MNISSNSWRTNLVQKKPGIHQLWLWFLCKCCSELFRNKVEDYFYPTTTPDPPTPLCCDLQWTLPVVEVFRVNQFLLSQVTGFSNSASYKFRSVCAFFFFLMGVGWRAPLANTSHSQFSHRNLQPIVWIFKSVAAGSILLPWCVTKVVWEFQTILCCHIFMPALGCCCCCCLV